MRAKYPQIVGEVSLKAGWRITAGKIMETMQVLGSQNRKLIWRDSEVESFFHLLRTGFIIQEGDFSNSY